MQEHAPPHPGIHFEESQSFHFFDVNRLALIQHGKVHRQMDFLLQGAHEQESHISDIEVGLDVSAEAENFQTETIAPTFRITPQIAARLEGPKDITSGAFEDGELAADFRVGQAVAAMRSGFENIENALDGGRWTRIRGGHEIS